MSTIDLRSDTVTQPTDAMRRAMAEARLGDDVFGEDPTIRRLEELAADLTGKEAALFVPSGTMANLVCLLTHCGRGDEFIVGDQAHIFYYEQGGSAQVGGIHPRTVPNLTDGTLDLEGVRHAIRPDDVHFPRTRLIALENTHNRCSGTPLPPDYLQKVADLAAANGLRIHVDGARIFNAAAALGVSVKRLAGAADSLSFCLSKGLAAPVGSLVCSDGNFVMQARRYRKVLGGGMRQAGVLAAAGIVALETMTTRLAEDHANAQHLARGLSALPGIELNPENVRTNIVYFNLAPPAPSAAEIVDRLSERGIKVLATGPNQ
ncbi:MAG: low-specificity L-threonine aldolase, partial [Desulfobacterales bacterium]|nr:low-specificity L-threonine aldolase [Desulfobacterales bacterium]